MRFLFFKTNCFSWSFNCISFLSHSLDLHIFKLFMIIKIFSQMIFLLDRSMSFFILDLLLSRPAANCYPGTSLNYASSWNNNGSVCFLDHRFYFFLVYSLYCSNFQILLEKVFRKEALVSSSMSENNLTWFVGLLEGQLPHFLLAPVLLIRVQYPCGMSSFLLSRISGFKNCSFIHPINSADYISSCVLKTGQWAR